MLFVKRAKKWKVTCLKKNLLNKYSLFFIKILAPGHTDCARLCARDIWLCKTAGAIDYLSMQVFIYKNSNFTLPCKNNIISDGKGEGRKQQDANISRKWWPSRRVLCFHLGFIGQTWMFVISLHITFFKNYLKKTKTMAFKSDEESVFSNVRLGRNGAIDTVTESCSSL